MIPLPEPLLHALHDPWVTDIILRESRPALIDRGRGMEPLELGGFPLKEWTLERLSASGKTWSAQSPFVDSHLDTQSGRTHRLHAIFPPASPSGVEVSLRRLPGNGNARARLWENDPYCRLLREWVKEARSFMITGATGSGKTSLLDLLLESAGPDERVLALEDTPEISGAHPGFTRLLTRPKSVDGFGEITLSDLIRQTLRMRPDRIVLGECRGREVLDLLQLLNTGHKGAMATLHANSARDGARRLELLCALHGSANLSREALRELIGNGLHGFVHVERARDGRRRVAECLEIAGRERDTLLFRPVTLPEALLTRERL